MLLHDKINESTSESVNIYTLKLDPQHGKKLIHVYIRMQQVMPISLVTLARAEKSMGPCNQASTNEELTRPP